MDAFRFDCVFYFVRDLDRAIEFYANVLGFRLSSRDAVGRFDLDGVLIELVPTDDPGVLSGRGNARLTLLVEDVEAAASNLRSLDVGVSEVRQVSNGRLATFHDPDGNEIVLWQYQ
jgi:catechol 2,3-dioxygenase-like lactoylglutathione lyase family enzyme